jgi:hypothetical protein
VGEPFEDRGNGRIMLKYALEKQTEISIVFFWIVRSCSLAGGYQRFGETHCLHLYDRSECRW